MNKVHSGAVLCALFCGWLVVTGCIPLSSLAIAESFLLQTAMPTPPSTLQHAPAAVAPVVTPIAQPLSMTPAPVASAVSTPGLVPAGTVLFYEEEVTLPTYPFERYQTAVVDPDYQWPYQRFDVERFWQEAPKPTPRTYRLLVLENAYLKIIFLPELGGRIWQVIHKPSGAPMFYQNKVVKPTHWGSENQKGWLALGGIEWGLPVVEHGYDWGVPWDYSFQSSTDSAAVTVATPRDGRYLHASITVSLRADEASFTIEPTLTNLTAKPLAFSFWHDAMLAPGSGSHPSAQLHFVLPGRTMTLHSTNDAALPQPDKRFPWPIYRGRDFSRLGSFDQYLGFFEAPAAHGPFVGVYDPAYDMGVVRTFPAQIARGSKLFSLGWQDALPSDNFTDDDSMYVELHGGLAPTFGDQAKLPANGQISWREVWYPVAGIGDLRFANEMAALAVQPRNRQLAIGLYTTRPVEGALVALVDGVVQASLPVQVRPDAPYRGLLPVSPTTRQLTLQLQDSAGQPLFTYPFAP
ncbi:MAG: DUF5107 domain-containing protein [Caldilineaceae bacterium]|nr:DUF5107 domain-containing protein [Caldilineaceae bacterium]